MSRQINQPINQVRLTNVAVVRYNHGGQRFEIACYRNKVMDYRAGLETDLTEVLQSERIFTNVSKGQFAKRSNLIKVFGTHDEEEIAKRILRDGSSLQVSDLERQQQIQNTLAQVATWVSQHCVHPQRQRPYTVSQIKHLLTKNYTIHPDLANNNNKAAMKRQYLDAVKYLKTVVPIERAKMELMLQYPSSQQDKVDALLQLTPHKLVSQQDSDSSSSSIRKITIQVDPAEYRKLDEFVSKDLKGNDDASLEILQHVVFQKGDVDLELELNNNDTNDGEEDNEATDSNNKKSKEKSSKFTSDDVSSSDEEALDIVNKLEQVRIKASGYNEEDEDEDDESSSDDNGIVSTTNTAFPSTNDDDDSEDDSDSSSDYGKRPVSRKEKKKQQKRKDKIRQKQQDQPDDTSDDHVVVQSMQVPRTTMNETTTLDAKSCNTCGGAFATAAEYRTHFRSDWHKFNQKLKLKGIAAVSEKEFMLCDADTFFGNGSNLDD